MLKEGFHFFDSDLNKWANSVRVNKIQFERNLKYCFCINYAYRNCINYAYRNECGFVLVAKIITFAQHNTIQLHFYLLT